MSKIMLLFKRKLDYEDTLINNSILGKRCVFYNQGLFAAGLDKNNTAFYTG